MPGDQSNVKIFNKNEILLFILLNLTYRPTLGEVHENNYNNNEVNKHYKTKYKCKTNISMLIQEIFFYLRVLIEAN